MSKKSAIPPHPLKTKDGSKHLFQIFHMLGIFMPNGCKVSFVIYSFIWNIFRLIIIPLMYTLSYFDSSNREQINNFLSSLQVCFNTYGGSIKFVVVVCMLRYFYKIEAIFDKLDTRIRHPDEIREAEGAILYGKRAVIIYFICYYGHTTIALLAAIYMGRPPYSLYIPFLNWHTSSLNFYIVCAIENFAINSSLLQQMVNDTYAIIYIGILRSHFKILIMRVLRIGTDQNCTKEDNQKELVHCIQDHCHILEVINAVAPVMSLTYFIQFVITITCLAATLINITISNDTSTLLASATYIMGLMFQIMPISYIVNTLVAESDRLPQAIFHMNWLDQSLKFRRACLFFIHRSQKTIVLRAGRLFPISLDSFASIIKFTFSVYTLMKNMDFAAKFNK